MEHGDIDNRLPPRWLIVFEGVIGHHPVATDRGAYDLYVKLHQWKRAVRTYQLNGETNKRLWHLTWHQNYKFDVATFLPEKCEDHVRDWLDSYNVPCANVRHYTDPGALGRLLAYMPDVYCVVHGQPSNRFTYGNKGILVSEGWIL